MRVALFISYDGTAFHGFESQPNKRTIQGELTLALQKLYNEDISVTASGRTDAGVHALAQVVHYDASEKIQGDKIAGALNFFLPPDIRVSKAVPVVDEFHARKSAVKKTYRYDMYVSKTENPLLTNRAHRLQTRPNLNAMKSAAALFIGEHDFSQFYCLGSSAKTTTRTIHDCRIDTSNCYGEEIISVTVTANGFLYKMVRIIVGTLIKAANEKLSLTDLTAYLNNTQKNPKTPAPACGLYLVEVVY